MKNYLRLARQAKQKRPSESKLRRIMIEAIEAKEFDQAHQIAVEFPRAIDDALVQRLQIATLAALSKARRETYKK